MQNAKCKMQNANRMRAPHDTWFQSIVFGEIIFQLPFFFYVLYGLWNPTKVDGSGLFRSLCAVYGAHTSTTLIPILACHVMNPDANAREKVAIVSISLPYLLFPLWMVFICIVSRDVFFDGGASQTESGDKKKR